EECQQPDYYLCLEEVGKQSANDSSHEAATYCGCHGHSEKRLLRLCTPDSNDARLRYPHHQQEIHDCAWNPMFHECCQRRVMRRAGSVYQVLRCEIVSAERREAAVTDAKRVRLEHDQAGLELLDTSLGTVIHALILPGGRL